MRTFNVPMSHPYIQNLTDFDLNFIDWASALDDPKLREKIENTVYDDDFDNWYNEQLESQLDGTEEAEDTPLPTRGAQIGGLTPDVDTKPVKGTNTPENAKLGGYTQSKENATETDWEEVK